MKYLLILLLPLITGKAYSQDFKSQIDAHRKQYKQDFLDDKHSPLKGPDLLNLRFYDADSTYRITADAELLTNQQPFQIPTFTGANKQYIRYAVLRFALKGKQVKMNVYRSEALASRPGLADYLFLPFTDETNGNETYGGGRLPGPENYGYKRRPPGN